jgi:hypothetical protein
MKVTEGKRGAIVSLLSGLIDQAKGEVLGTKWGK